MGNQGTRFNISMERLMNQKYIFVEPPFYPNLPDESHCLQACVKMAIEAIPPFRKLDYQELDELTGKTRLKAKYSWPLELYLALNKLGYDISIVENFDYQSFVNSPEKYLIDNYGEEVGRDQIENSDLNNETFFAQKLIESKSINLIKKIPEIQDIFDAILDGSLIICNVNQKILQGDDGYVGHFIIVYGFDNSNNILYIHNPGPPYISKQCLNISLFDQAWSYPTKKSRNIIAIKSSLQ
jgi:hypothetical protein